MHLSQDISKMDAFIFANYRIIHGARVAIAFISTMLLTTYFEVPERTWIMITLLVVIAPISYLGNVLTRAWHRAFGTLLGAVSGVFGIFLAQYSLPLMYIWCTVVVFFSAYLALGKRPYVGLLIGITLAVTIGAGDNDIEIAIWRGVDVTIGCIIAVVFCLFYPQRAFIHWRLRVSNALGSFARIYHLSYSPNVLEKPDLTSFQRTLVKEMATLRALTPPSVKETHLNEQVLNAIQVKLRNILYSLELLNHSYWSDRTSHLNMLWSKTLKDCQQQIEAEFSDLAHLMKTGELRDGRCEQEAMLIIQELKELISDMDGQETNIYGYVWLNLKLIEELADLKRLFTFALNLSHKS